MSYKLVLVRREQIQELLRWRDSAHLIFSSQASWSSWYPSCRYLRYLQMVMNNSFNASIWNVHCSHNFQYLRSPVFHSSNYRWADRIRWPPGAGIVFKWLASTSKLIKPSSQSLYKRWCTVPVYGTQAIMYFFLNNFFTQELNHCSKLKFWIFHYFVTVVTFNGRWRHK